MKIIIFDQIGSFSGELADHWDKRGHEVAIHPQYDPHFLIGTDLCFCEWADQNAVAAAHQRLPIPLIVRLHSYEAFTPWPSQIRWHNVDKLIFVAPHVQKFVRHRFIPACPNLVIPNGIDPDKWDYKSRVRIEKPKVALIGEIGHKKGIQLFMEVAQQWTKAEFWIAGPVTDERYFVMLNDMATKAGLQERIFYSGYQSDINKYLNIFDYLICCSPWEGHNYSIMQAMAKGIKPLIYNFNGAEDLYPKELLWTSMKELKDIVDGSYTSATYRQWIIDKGWTLENQFKQFDEVIANPKAKTIEDVKNFYDTFVPILENDLSGQNPRLKAIENHILGWITDKDRVVDMGCGVGITTNWISKQAKEVVGLELSSELVESAKRNFPKLNFHSHDITKEFNLAVDVGDNLTATLFDCLEHILPCCRPKLYKELEKYDKVIMTLPTGQKQSGRPLQIVDEEIDEAEIFNALPEHRVAYDTSYDLGNYGKYKFIVLEKKKIAVPEDNSKGEVSELAVAV